MALRKTCSCKYTVIRHKPRGVGMTSHNAQDPQLHSLTFHMLDERQRTATLFFVVFIRYSSAA